MEMEVSFVCFFVWFAVSSFAQKGDQSYSLEGDWLKSVSVRRQLGKKGFHRELQTFVRFDPDIPSGLCVLLIENLSSSLYVDRYELASLQENSGTQVLLNSEVDLEAPAYSSSGFSLLVYPVISDTCSGCFVASFPIHARYHRPSSVGKKHVLINIDGPRLLVTFETGLLPWNNSEYLKTMVQCSAQNNSLCHWMEIAYKQEVLSLQIPVGDEHGLCIVCTGTLLVIVLCSGLLGRVIWRNVQFQL
ncbi:phosphatidylinositol-glycan biosynthesis class X protein isoform X1 [Erpetoichthys calabaricus]|uniref:phosphatidylinositol-glycan biosynthesis class X protein isoform X1 n=1 Tax=Erpetoichthys calabaricus TaxID=27687 RepID=UPI0022340B6D|nr:phosphatidylinositol-glycan biosynthesis class X protein isoform X1 [Erpetoichthys calabaricus]